MSRTPPNDEDRPSPGPNRTTDELPRTNASPEPQSRRLSNQMTRWLDPVLTILAFVWTAVVIAELTLEVSPEVRALLADLDVAIWFAFAVAFFLQWALASDRLLYLRTHIPSAIAVVLPVVRVIQVVGAIRLLRPAWLAQLILVGNRAIRGAGELFKQQRLYYVIALLAISTLLGAAGVYFFERDQPGSEFRNFGDPLWWAATLATTINTNVDPVTFEGRIVGWILRVIALAFFGFVTGSIASFLTAERVVRPTRLEWGEEDRDKVELAREVAELRTLLERLEAQLDARDASDRRE